MKKTCYFVHLFSITGQIYCSVITGITFITGGGPLFFEMAVEVCYPSPEVVVAGLLTGTMNFLGIIFLFVFFAPNIGKLKYVSFIKMDFILSLLFRFLYDLGENYCINVDSFM